MVAGVQVLHSRPNEVATIDAYSPANERINNEYVVLVANCVFRTVHSKYHGISFWSTK